MTDLDYVFVERKNQRNVTARLGITNLIGARSMWDRTVYMDRRTGPVDFYEVRNRRIGPIFSFTFSGEVLSGIAQLAIPQQKARLRGPLLYLRCVESVSLIPLLEVSLVNPVFGR